MTSQKAPCNITGVSKRRYLQNSTPDNPELTGFHGFLTQIQMETDVPQAWTRHCRQLPDRPRPTLMDIYGRTMMWYMTQKQ